jgi:hypothetical protein
MPQRPPSFADRLRSALGSDHTTTPVRPAPARHAQDYKGAEFADRLRAAVATRR